MTRKEGYTPHPFDAQYDVRTSGLIPGRYLKTGHTHDRHSTAYFGVAPSVFQALLKRWQRTVPAAPVDSFTFMDIGAGMGRAMLLASQHPFRKVIGIELNPLLADIASRNITKWQAAERRSRLCGIICGDIIDARIPQWPVPAFPFQSFRRAAVMRRLLVRLAHIFSKRPGQLDLPPYVNHEQEHVIECQPGFKRLLPRADSSLLHRLHRRSQNHGQPARWRICLRQLRGLLHLALDRQIIILTGKS